MLIYQSCPWNIMEHEQVKLSDGSIVDKQIITLISRINALGFKTDMSCQNVNGFIWIRFPHPCQVNEFVQYLFATISRLSGESIGSAKFFEWNVGTVHRISGIGENAWKATFSVIPGISLWIPISDRDLLERLLE